MKPFLKIIDSQQNNAFQVLHVNERYFFPTWHFHPELEIMLVLEGTGIRIIGDSIERFEPGDLVFLGSNIPHLYRSDEPFYREDSYLRSKAIVIYFRKNFAGDQFWNMPEMTPIRKLFQVAQKGLKFQETARMVLSSHVSMLARRHEGIDRVLDLLTILKYMAQTSEATVLSEYSSIPNMQTNDRERINDVYQFILDNYASNPTLEEVARVACMSATAFCRCFKKHTNKTYVQFLNEVRIGNATKLLIDDKMTISRVCFETGFNNFNHFNNIFKRFTGFTPGQYQQHYTERPSKFV